MEDYAWLCINARIGDASFRHEWSTLSIWLGVQWPGRLCYELGCPVLNQAAGGITVPGAVPRWQVRIVGLASGSRPSGSGVDRARHRGARRIRAAHRD